MNAKAWLQQAKVPSLIKCASALFGFSEAAPHSCIQDLADNTLVLPQPLTELPLTYIMGDCHTGNFGFHSEEGSHGDSLIFEPNDFDDACVGHAVWDLFRYLVSLLSRNLKGQTARIRHRR